MYVLPLLLTLFQPVEGPGLKLLVKDLSLIGPGRKTYNIKALTKGKAAFLVNLYALDSSQGIADLNRLDRMMAGEIKVVGLMSSSDYGLMRTRVKALGIRFLVVCSDGEGGILGIVPRLNTSPGGYIDYLANTLLLPDGRLTHVWTGYNRWTLKRMSQDARLYAHVRLKLDLKSFPEKLQSGPGFYYGSGEP